MRITYSFTKILNIDVKDDFYIILLEIIPTISINAFKYSKLYKLDGSINIAWLIWNFTIHIDRNYE